MLLVSAAVAPLASADTAAPRPCAVVYAASGSVHAGVTTALQVTCDADHTSAVTGAIHVAGSATRNCSGRGASALTLACHVGGAKKGHVYAVRFEFTALGNYAVCADDGACDATANQDPHCTASTLADQQQKAGRNELLHCVYALPVAVTG